MQKPFLALSLSFFSSISFFFPFFLPFNCIFLQENKVGSRWSWERLDLCLGANLNLKNTCIVSQQDSTRLPRSPAHGLDLHFSEGRRSSSCFHVGVFYQLWPSLKGKNVLEVAVVQGCQGRLGRSYPTPFR